jgi:hypothetical protein
LPLAVDASVPFLSPTDVMTGPRIMMGSFLENAAKDLDSRLVLAWGVKEAPPGFEPGMKVLQTSALPLGYGARKRSASGNSPGNGS